MHFGNLSPRFLLAEICRCWNRHCCFWHKTAWPSQHELPCVSVLQLLSSCFVCRKKESSQQSCDRPEHLDLETYPGLRFWTNSTRCMHLPSSLLAQLLRTAACAWPYDLFFLCSCRASARTVSAPQSFERFACRSLHFLSFFLVVMSFLSERAQQLLSLSPSTPKSRNALLFFLHL